MFKGISKYMLIGAAAAMLAACGDKNREGASELYTQSEQEIDNQNYSAALVLLDTLNSRYPDQTAIRRDGLRLRARAMEGIAVDSISVLDRERAEAMLRVEELQAGFRHVDSSVGLDGYFLPTGVSDQVMTATGIQPRVSDKGFFYIVVNIQGKAIGLNSIELVAGADNISSASISPARVIKVEGSESASFNPEEVDLIGPWLKDHPSASQIILRGSKGDVKVKMTEKLRKQIVECYDYAAALQANRRASIRREKFERMLATARDQLANLPLPETAK